MRVTTIIGGRASTREVAAQSYPHGYDAKSCDVPVGPTPRLSAVRGYDGSRAMVRGVEFSCSAVSGSKYDAHQNFSGKERDSETNLDYFGARYYSGAQGRFTSADEPLVDQSAANPQSWNLYAYARNNPLTNRDPNGRWCVFGTIGTTCHDKEIPPPPPPPAPKPPAVITPGTPQNKLANAQDAARTDPQFAPQPNGGATYCNLATCHIVSATGAPSNGLVNAQGTPNLANTDARTLANSQQWSEVTPDQAQNLANQGVTVVAVQSNPEGHGHIVTVRPELLPGTQVGLGMQPLVNNIGRAREITTSDRAFARDQPVRYYAPNNSQQH